MRGTMYERRPGVWTLRVYVGRDAGGRPVQVSRTLRGPKREAETALAKYVAELSEAKPAKDGLGASVGQLLDEWVQVGKQRGLDSIHRASVPQLRGRADPTRVGRREAHQVRS